MVLKYMNWPLGNLKKMLGFFFFHIGNLEIVYKIQNNHMLKPEELGPVPHSCCLFKNH